MMICTLTSSIERALTYILPLYETGLDVISEPIFLVIKDDFVRLLNVDHDSTMDKLVDYIPQIFDFIKTFNKDSTKENKK